MTKIPFNNFEKIWAKAWRFATSQGANGFNQFRQVKYLKIQLIISSENRTEQYFDLISPEITCNVL